jgi:hypothetical protein
MSKSLFLSRWHGLYLHRPRDSLLKLLLGLLLGSRCMLGHSRLIRSDDLVQDRPLYPPHLVNESLRGLHTLRRLIVGQQYWDPSGRLIFQAQLLVQDLARPSNRDPMG